VVTGNNATDFNLSNGRFNAIDAGAIFINSTSAKFSASNLTFNNCRTDADSGAVVQLSNSHTSIIQGCTFQNSPLPGTTAAYGITTAGTHNKVVVTGNTFENFGDGDIGGLAATTFTDEYRATNNATDAAAGVKDTTHIQVIAQLPDEATPSVLYGKYFVTIGTANDPITDFDDGITGQVITIIAEHEAVITDGTNIFLDGSPGAGGWTMTASDTLTLICKADGFWYELSRSDSGA
jgi:hypothetical protein